MRMKRNEKQATRGSRGNLSGERAKKNARISIAIFAAIIIAAALVRVSCIAELSSSKMGEALSVDAKFYRNVASEIASGKNLPTGALTFNPLYPFFLAAVFKLFGESLLATRIVQSFLGLLTIVLVYFAGRRLVKGESKETLRADRVAALAAAMAVLFPIFVLYEAMILATTLEIFLLVSSFALSLAIDEDLHRVEPMSMGRRKFPTWLYGVLLGVLCGAGSLARPNLFLLLVPGLFFWLVARNRRERAWVVPAVGFVAGVALFLSPPTLYNYASTGRFVPVTTHGGINFYIGNRPGSIGVYEVPAGVRGSMRGLIEDARVRAEKESGRRMTDAESSDYYMRKALEYIKSDPAGWILLLGRKAILFWNKVEIHDMPDAFFFQRTLAVFRFLVLPFSIVAPLGLAGFVVLLLEKRNRSIVCLFLGSSLASVMLFYVNTRYRIPIVPIVMILAALFVSWFFREIYSRRIKLPAILAIAALVFFFAVSNRTIVSANEASVYVYLGNYYMNTGEETKAAEAFAEAYRLDPNLDVAIINYGRVMLRRNDFARAAELFARGYALNPRYPRLAIEYAFALDNLGKKDEARGLYREVFESGRPEEKVIACKALAQQAFFEGKKNEVLEWVKAGLAISPQDEELAAMFEAAESMP